MPIRYSLVSLAVVLTVALGTPVANRSLTAQALPSLFESGRPGAVPKARPVRPHQARKARLRLDALNAPAFRLNLFDNAERTAYRARVDQTAEGRFVWHGTTDDGGIVTLAVVNGVTTGTAYLDGRSFEIIPDEDGEHTIEELNAAAFPTEEGPLDLLDVELAADTGGSATSTATVAADGTTEIGVMVLWTPAARSAAGGQANIESLILAAVSNANLAYTNSLVNARLKLVYSAEVAFTETPSNLSGDLSALRSTGDGKIDGIHALRDQYGADIVSLIGNGYAAAGYCGVGYLMSSASTSFAPSAFNIVDRTCAAGYLSFAHEVGHNQGLHHDPANASGSASYSYAYGYQDTGGLFRTVLSYGGATRIPYLSNPGVLYSGRVTGTANQDNARALNNNASIVAAFRGGTTPSCSYTVTPTTLSFGAAAGTATVSVSTTSGCSWTSTSGSTWAAVTGSGSGSGTATVSVTSNGSSSRSATITVAGKTVTVTQAAASSCTFSVAPTTLSFTSSGGSATVSVTTTAGCSWSSSSGLSWATASGSGSGSGSATVTVLSTTGGSRSGSVTVAGKTVSVSQSGATIRRSGPKK